MGIQNLRIRVNAVKNGFNKNTLVYVCVCRKAQRTRDIFVFLEKVVCWPRFKYRDAYTERPRTVFFPKCDSHS